MTGKQKIQALPQGRATDEWLLRHLVDVIDNIIAAIDKMDERLGALEQRVRDVEQTSSRGN